MTRLEVEAVVEVMYSFGFEGVAYPPLVVQTLH